MQASNNNYQLIFLMASSVTVAATLAFVLLVPSHARPMSQQETAAKQFKQRTVEAAASGAPAPVAEAVHEPFSLLKLCKVGKGLRADKGVRAERSLGRTRVSQQRWVQG